MAVNNIVKRIQNIMRQDAGVNGDAQRIEQMTWMFFLKVYDTQEETWEYKACREGKTYVSIILKNCAGAIGLWMKKTGKHLLVTLSCLW